MTDKQFYLAVTESPNYTDPDAFVSDIALSSEFEGEKLTDTLLKNLRQVHGIVTSNIVDIRKTTGMSQSQFAQHFCISLRSIQNWEQNERECPIHVKLLMAESLNLITR